MGAIHWFACRECGDLVRSGSYNHATKTCVSCTPKFKARMAAEAQATQAAEDMVLGQSSTAKGKV